MGRRPWKKRAKLIKNKGEVFQGGLSTDVIIPVMGKTGVGKSTFINTLLQKGAMKVGHDIVSCTVDLQWEVISPESIREIRRDWGDRRVIIVDTPGFDDTYKDDSEILRRIGVWLASSYDDNMKLGGIIYLQNIAERRMEGASRRNLDMFKKLCGDKALNRVVLGTTSWQEVLEKVGKSREEELKNKFWKEMTARGSAVERFYLTHDSALGILRLILERSEPDPVLKIQEEMVDLMKLIPQTEAGKELLYSIDQILKMHKELEPGDEKEREELRQKVQVLENQIKELSVPFLTRLKAMFGL